MIKSQKILLLLLIIGATTQSSAFAQKTEISEHDNILKPIVDLFDSMRAQDTTLLQSVFINEPYLATIFGQTGNLSYRDSATLNDFINSIASHEGEVLDERINTDDIITHSDSMMATAWVPYQFFVGDTFSHCGVNVFVMMKNETGNWKITSITDTRRNNGCTTD